jgi:glycosyltransferase involved in cell wall biosynthesis
MKISIITVVLNGAMTIERNLDSIAEQRTCHADLEHIVIDGRSTDGTLEILQKWRNQIEILISESDAGLYDAMNKGIRLATGDIVGILNADDYYANRHVLRDVSTIFQSSDVDAVFGDLEYFNPSQPSISTRLYRSAHFTPEKLPRGLMPAHPTLFLRKSVYDRFGLFKPEYKIAGDFDFIARIFKSSELRYVYVPQTLIRMQTGGISTKGIRSTFLLNKEILRSCQENQIPTNFLKLLLRYPKKIFEYFPIRQS